MIKMVKRSDMTKRKSVGIRFAAILLALFTAGLFILALGHNPIEVYISMLLGAFGSAYRIKSTFTIAIPLIVASLGIMISFKMKFWNIGAEGQILMGAFFASYFALNFSYLPKPILLTIMFIGGFIGGGLWAVIPAILKTKFNTNETIITLMLNYVAMQWILYLQYGPWKDPSSMGFPKIARFTENAVMGKVFGVHFGWIIALMLVFILWYLMKYSKWGYHISVVGESVDTANYSGMNVNKIIVTSVLVSGGICGIVGVMEASAVNQTLTYAVSGGYGFTAIITAWLSGLQPFLIVPVSIMFAALEKGGSFIQTAFEIPQSAAEVLQSMILFFVIGSEFFIQYKVKLDKKIKVIKEVK